MRRGLTTLLVIVMLIPIIPTLGEYDGIMPEKKDQSLQQGEGFNNSVLDNLPILESGMRVNISEDQQWGEFVWYKFEAAADKSYSFDYISEGAIHIPDLYGENWNYIQHFDNSWNGDTIEVKYGNLTGNYYLQIPLYYTSNYTLNVLEYDGRHPDLYTDFEGRSQEITEPGKVEITEQYLNFTLSEKQDWYIEIENTGDFYYSFYIYQSDGTLMHNAVQERTSFGNALGLMNFSGQVVLRLSGYQGREVQVNFGGAEILSSPIITQYEISAEIPLNTRITYDLYEEYCDYNENCEPHDDPTATVWYELKQDIPAITDYNSIRELQNLLYENQDNGYNALPIKARLSTGELVNKPLMMEKVLFQDSRELNGEKMSLWWNMGEIEAVQYKTDSPLLQAKYFKDDNWLYQLVLQGRNEGVNLEGYGVYYSMEEGELTYNISAVEDILEYDIGEGGNLRIVLLTNYLEFNMLTRFPRDISRFIQVLHNGEGILDYWQKVDFFEEFFLPTTLRTPDGNFSMFEKILDPNGIMTTPNRGNFDYSDGSLVGDTWIETRWEGQGTNTWKYDTSSGILTDFKANRVDGEKMHLYLDEIEIKTDRTKTTTTTDNTETPTPTIITRPSDTGGEDTSSELASKESALNMYSSSLVILVQLSSFGIMLRRYKNRK